MMNIYKLLIVSITLIAGASVSEAAPEAKMHITMSAKSFFVGEEFLYEILISPAEKIDAEEIEGDDDLAIQFLKKERLEKDGISTVALRYRMIPLNAGMVMIPPMSIEVGDQELTTDEEAFIHVKQAESYPDMEILREIPDRDFYLGEPVLVNYMWKSPLPLNGFRAVKLNLPLFYDAAFKITTPHNWIAENDKAAIGFPVANSRVIGRYESLKEGEKDFQTVSFAKIIIPVKTGEFSVRPSTLLASYVAPPSGRKLGQAWSTNYPSYFNNNFFANTDDGEFKKYFASSKAKTIRVLPLPDEGRPHDFAGQVGACKVTVTATPTVLKEGDPITLTIVVDDYEHPEIFEFPDIGKQAAFTRQFATPPRQSSGRIEGEKKTYIRTLRPLSQSVTAIPSVRITYFDPKTKSYGVAESAPISITVKAAEMVTAFDASMSGTGPLRNLLEQNDQGIRANFATVDAIKGGSLSGLQWFLILLVLPPAGFFIFYAATAKSRLMAKDPQKVRAMAAMKRFKKKITQLEQSNPEAKPEQSVGELDDLVRNYFAEKLNLVRHAHTFEELKNEVNGRVDIEPLRIVYESCESQAYQAGSKSQADIISLIQRTEQAVKNINQALS